MTKVYSSSALMLETDTSQSGNFTGNPKHLDIVFQKKELAARAAEAITEAMAVEMARGQGVSGI